MNRILRTTGLASALLLVAASAFAQITPSAPAQMAALNSFKEKVKDPDTRTRVAAFHQVWMIALSSDSGDVKILALELMREPAASASDHIRMPALYAIAEVANSTADPAVKAKALSVLSAPVTSGQLPIRLATIDVVNSILRAPVSAPLALQALELLGEPLRSGNNGARIPAINAGDPDCPRIERRSRGQRRARSNAVAPELHGADRRHGSAVDGRGRSRAAWTEIRTRNQSKSPGNVAGLRRE
jgi:hypothetical protein